MFDASLIPFTGRWAQARRYRLGIPKMTRSETRLLYKYVAGKDLFLEFGSGTSTLFAAATGVKCIISVETDPLWIARLRCDDRLKGADVSFLHADIGPTERYGNPADESRRANWPNYSRLPWPAKPSVTLVDGRFRVACALTAALHTDQPILVHDYFGRPAYEAIERNLNLIDKADTLAVFVARNGNEEALRAEIRNYEYDYR